MAPEPTLREMMATLSERLTNHISQDEEDRAADRQERARMHRDNVERAEKASDARREMHKKIDSLAEAVGKIELGVAKAEVVAAKSANKPLWAVIGAMATLLLALAGATAYLADRQYTKEPQPKEWKP